MTLPDGRLIVVVNVIVVAVVVYTVILPGANVPGKPVIPVKATLKADAVYSTLLVAMLEE